ncbi:DUF2442 domain-containing protein [Spirosoma sp. KUDC1026]|uniref:DUF2442 domain-containing protein n=1 Tax=Spirosoma sp. KUDC1026 TaxID=2745947 RepID=UPI00159B9CB8|nr:DUF2442 domain-containing protein [Spirosoma sp. KUDC1026]QKZ15143.1 DUF2442 domain-containing protein [Spirosoma sp. KUDC1026]
MKTISSLPTKHLGNTGKVIGDTKVSNPKPSTSQTPGSATIKHPLEILPEFLPDLVAVSVKDTDVLCSFEDGRTLSFPLQWSDKLSKATTAQRQAFEFNAHFIFWDDLDEIIGVRNILLGNKLHW